MNKYNDNYYSTMDSSAINESFICQTALDTVKKYNYNVNVTIEEKTNNSLVNKLDRRKNINLKLTSSSRSCTITENITICLDKTDISTHDIVNECKGPKLNENNCEKYETIFVFIKEENPNLKKCINGDKCFEKSRSVSTSTSDILSRFTKDNSCRITDNFSTCTIKKESTSWRSVLPTCAVKNIEQIPRCKNNSLEEMTEKNNNQFIPVNNNLKITESLSTMNIIKEISFDSSESSSTSSSTSFNSVHIPSMDLIDCTMNNGDNALFQLCNSYISSVFSSSFMSMPPLIPKNKLQCCCRRKKTFDSTMKVYQDFFVYHGGIYRHSKLAENYRTGYHSVRIIGWGEEFSGNNPPVKYWIVANSWGTHWGENGFFRIQKGINECEIETFVLGIWAKTI
ncbi:hypothetical protein PV327_008864 [Microctonus hyperodae]|nr:hypothetical protein PV327_008864 [Microctonus hyperodae]